MRWRLFPDLAPARLALLVKLTAADEEVDEPVHKRKPRCDYVLA